MRSVKKLRLSVFAGFCLAVSALYAEVLVCSYCGYESPEGSTACSHCKAKLSPPPKKSPSDDLPAGNAMQAGKIKFIDSSLVENEVKTAGKYLDSGEPEIANLFARNAAALESLVDPEAKGDGRAALVIEIRKKSETGGMTVARTCPACLGTGKYVMESEALDGKTTTVEVAGKSCQKCAGTGKVMKYSTMDERRFKLGRAMSTYRSLQQSRRFAPLGAAWIPATLDGNLSLKQAAQVKRAVVSPCSECMGLGRIDCTKCKGHGEIKCAVAGCVNGKIEVKDEGSLVKGKMKKSVKCRNCSGTGFVACADCRSKGSIVCKKCSGSGERSLCVKCGGQGFMSCKRCKGSGVYKEVACTECRGEGIQECSACNGDGRKR